MLKYKMFNSIFLMSLMVVFLSSEVHTTGIPQVYTPGRPQVHTPVIPYVHGQRTVPGITGLGTFGRVAGDGHFQVPYNPFIPHVEGQSDYGSSFLPSTDTGIHRKRPVIISEFNGVTCSAVAGEGQSDIELSTCLSDTGRKISGAEVANLSKFAVADEPSCNDGDGPLERFFAMLTTNLRELIKKDHLDPKALPNADVHFSKRVGPITFHGDATADNGSFKGLATIDITGEPTRDDEHRVNGIHLSATFKELKGHYDLEASFMALKIKGSITLEDKNPTLSISTSLNRTACRLHVTEILTDIGDISLTVCGLGPLGWILNHVVGGVGVVVQAFIKGLGNSLKALITKYLDHVDLSIIRGILGCLNKTEMINPTTLSRYTLQEELE